VVSSGIEPRRTRFRPCIDLHEGQVKQVVGGTFTDDGGVKVNHASEHPPAWFAERYRDDGLEGGHVIKLGPGNDEAAREALAAWPGGLQLGGGITAENARAWIDAGASQVIVTSHLFDAGQRFREDRLEGLLEVVAPKELVIDLSCRAAPDGSWHVAMDRWRKQTDLALDATALERLAPHCAEFLIHAADVEGQCEGIDEDLVRFLGERSPIPCVYAGGAKALEDLARVSELSGGRVDLTIGSALDLFGGELVRYEDCVAFNG